MGKFDVTAGAEIKLDPLAAAITLGDMWSDFGDMIWQGTFCSYGDSPPPWSWIDFATTQDDFILLVQRPQQRGHVDKAPSVAEIKDKIMKAGRLDNLMHMRLIHVKLMGAVYRPVLGVKMHHHNDGLLNSCRIVLGESLGDLGYFE